MKPPDLFTVVREIGIDAGHRVTNHHSKCRSIHGHRYLIKAVCTGKLKIGGSTEGMAGGLDFGFLKDELLKTIDAPCDHAFIIWVDDPLLNILVPRHCVKDIVASNGYCPVVDEKVSAWGKLYIIPEVPTAENLARHWYQRLSPRIVERSENLAVLSQVIVFETPNCSAIYPSSFQDSEKPS